MAWDRQEPEDRREIERLVTAFHLKDTVRTGWTLRGVPHPESVADHSWGTALLCLLYAEEAGVDVGEALAVAVVHDVAEAITGDYPRRVDLRDEPISRAEKTTRERDAIRKLCSGLDPRRADRLSASWRAYEDRVDPAALFARDMNLVDMVLTALVYRKEGRYRRPCATESPSAGYGDDGVVADHGLSAYDALDEFFETARPRLRTDVGRRLFRQVEVAYRLVGDVS
jgi:putative hydrolases of HD superfamily